MKANELRIGNLISTKLNLIPQLKILQLFSDSFQGEYNNGDRGVFMYLSCDGIDITPEWLERLGFKFKSGRWIITDGQLTLRAKESPGGFKMMINSTHLKKINAVHQLQNLYFALTGKELSLTSKT